MKTCPKCNRTFEDSFSFCLEDGTVLSSSYHESDDDLPTDVLKENSAQNSPISFWKYAFIGLVLIFLFGTGVIALVVFINNSDAQNPSNNSAKLENRNSKSQKPESSQTQYPEELETSSPTIQEKTEETIPSSEKKTQGDKLDQGVSKLKQEMSYAVARRILIDSGWQAVVRSPNREKFGSEEYIFDKLNFYEVESCSGTGMGFCRFLFKDINNRKLVVITANNEEGIEGGPVVNNWSFEK